MTLPPQTAASMVDRFLRPPETYAETAADALRIIGVLGVILAFALFDVTDAGILAFALPGVFAPRFIGLRPSLDITVSVTLLIAAWSNVFDLYTSIWWWDIVVHLVLNGVLAAALHAFLVVHLVLNGVLAAALHAFLVTQSVLPRPGHPRPIATVGLTVALGLAMASLWEMVEWVGFEYVTQDIYVTYADTIGDMGLFGPGVGLATRGRS